MAIPLKYLPEPEDAIRLRLVVSRKEAKGLATLADAAELSLASYCRVLGLAALDGRIKTEDMIRLAKPFRVVRTAKVAAAPGKPGRPRKKAAT